LPPLHLRCSDPERLACCEQSLRLLASQLWAPAARGRAAAYATDSEEGLAVLLRAVLTGAELAVASAADDSWQVRWGRWRAVPAQGMGISECAAGPSGTAHTACLKCQRV
jgi:hypothetical protein